MGGGGGRYDRKRDAHYILCTFYEFVQEVERMNKETERGRTQEKMPRPRILSGVLPKVTPPSSPFGGTPPF